jgi:hypothetical protein
MITETKSTNHTMPLSNPNHDKQAKKPAQIATITKSSLRENRIDVTPG